MSLSDFVLNITLLSMITVAGAAIWSSRGYAFDLRNKAGNRRRDPNRQGGRRSNDSLMAS